MLTQTRTTRLISKPRTAWAREGGAGLRYSAARVRAALRQRRRDGWLAALPPSGPRHERVTVIRAGHPLAFVFRESAGGVGRFDRQRLEQALGEPLDSRAGADRLAAAGFGVVRVDGIQIQLRATDPRLARLVNRARLGPQRRGYDVHRVLEAVLCLPPQARRRRPVTDDRRLAAAQLLHDQWFIDVDDLLDCRPFVRLCSVWTI